MRIPVAEQETIIQINRGAKTANVYTCDSNWIGKLDKKYKRIKEYKQQKFVVAAEYAVPINNIKIKPPRNLSEESKKRLSEQLRKARNKKTDEDSLQNRI